MIRENAYFAAFSLFGVFMTKEKAAEICRILENEYPDAKPALKFASPYQLLVAVVLSAQCTDERVNKVTAELFKVADTPEKMLTLTQSELENYIFSCGFYHAKAEHILAASRSIVDNFGGEVPNTREKLQTLAGVGRKTANVVYAVAFGGNAIAVDTHVFRVSARMGLAKGKDPLDTEKKLMKILPESEWSKMHHCLIWHGRKVCKSRNPDCANCAVNALCEAYLKEGQKCSSIKKR